MAGDVAPPARYLTPAEIAGAAMLGGFRPGGEIENAVAIALAESGGNTNAFNDKPPDLSYGLWQINMYGDKGPERRKKFHIDDNRQLFTAGMNAVVAKRIRDEQGWEAWSTFKDGSYKTKLTQAREAAAHPKSSEGAGTAPQGGFAGGDPIANFLSSLGPVVLRIAGFVGGGILIVLGLVLYARGEVKSTVASVGKAVLK